MKSDQSKNKAELIQELQTLRKWVSSQGFTERKRVEEALWESEREFHFILNNIHEDIVVIDLDYRIVDINNKALVTSGFRREEVLGKHCFEIFHGHNISCDQRGEECTLKRVLETGESANCQHAHVRIDSSTAVYVDILLSPLKDSEGSVMYVIESMRDITNLVETQEALRESEHRLSSFMRSATEGFVLYDSKFNLSEINIKALEIFPEGTKKEDLIGRNMVEISPGLKETGRYDRYLEVVKSGEPVSYKDIISNTIFGTRYLSVKAFKVGEGLGLIFTDTTERKQAEEAIKKSRNQLRKLARKIELVREEERTKIACEIHDELGQALAAMQIDLAMLKKKIPTSDKEKQDKLKSMLELTGTITQTVKQISMELRPSILDDLGLIPALEWQTDEFQKRTGIKCQLTIEHPDIYLDQMLSTVLYRIYQEALTNIARHAEATQVKAALKEQDENIVLEVVDNGKGIGKEQIDSIDSLGIVSMKERCLTIDGDLKISGVPGKGTTVTVNVPVG